MRNAPGPTTPWLPSWKKHGDHHKDINELYLSVMNADFLAVVPRRRHNAAEANYGGDTPWMEVRKKRILPLRGPLGP